MTPFLSHSVCLGFLLRKQEEPTVLCLLQCLERKQFYMKAAGSFLNGWRLWYPVCSQSQVTLSTVWAHTCHRSTGVMEAEDKEFKASLGYIGSWRAAGLYETLSQINKKQEKGDFYPSTQWVMGKEGQERRQGPVSSLTWARDTSRSHRYSTGPIVLKLLLPLWGKPSATPGQSLQQSLHSLERGLVFIFWGPKSIRNVMRKRELGYPVITSYILQGPPQSKPSEDSTSDAIPSPCQRQTRDTPQVSPRLPPANRAIVNTTPASWPPP